MKLKQRNQGLLERFVHILKADTEPTKASTVIVCLLAAVGLYLRSKSDRSGDVALLLGMMPWYCWSWSLALLAVSRIVGLFFWEGLLITKLLTPALGIVVWGFFLAAAWVAPGFGLSILFLIPALQEAWILGRVFRDEGMI